LVRTHPWDIHIAGDGSRERERTLYFDNKRRKSFCQSDGAVQMNIKKRLDCIDVLIEDGHEVALASVVDEKVETASRCLGHGFYCSLDVFCVDDIELEKRYVGEALQLGHLGDGSRGCEYVITTFLELGGESRANAIVAAAGDEDGLFRRHSRRLKIEKSCGESEMSQYLGCQNSND
jgi:hypothetical protein